MTGLLVIRELRNDGVQEVYLLNAEEWTISAFQMWMLGLGDVGRSARHGSERNEILAYYPSVDEYEDLCSGDNPLYNSYHKQWADPEGLPCRYAPDPE